MIVKKKKESESESESKSESDRDIISSDVNLIKLGKINRENKESGDKIQKRKISRSLKGSCGWIIQK